MTIGAALLLIAVGAILRFAITTVTTHGVDVHTIGDILMIVGVIGLVIWFFVWAPWARNRRYSAPPQEERRPPEAYRNRDGRPIRPRSATGPPIRPRSATGPRIPRKSMVACTRRTTADGLRTRRTSANGLRTRLTTAPGIPPLT